MKRPKRPRRLHGRLSGLLMHRLMDLKRKPKLSQSGRFGHVQARQFADFSDSVDDGLPVGEERRRGLLPRSLRVQEGPQRHDQVAFLALFVSEDRTQQPLYQRRPFLKAREPQPRGTLGVPGAKYRRIKSRRGPMKALVAVEHAMLTAAWHMLTTGELYKDPGADYFIQRAPAAVKARAIGQLEALGYQVTIEPLMEAG